jgi:chemotaxis protein CheD
MPPDATLDAGRVVLGIGGLHACRADHGILITHALGSCLGITAYDARAKVGAMLHAQLPLAQLNPDLARDNPARFVDLGIPLLVQAAIDRGADRRQLKLVVAGGAMMIVTTNPLFNISSRNLTVMRKVLWQQGCLLAGEDTGGTQPRTMTLKLDTGETLIDSQGRRLTF